MNFLNLFKKQLEEAKVPEVPVKITVDESVFVNITLTLIIAGAVLLLFSRLKGGK